MNRHLKSSSDEGTHHALVHAHCALIKFLWDIRGLPLALPCCTGCSSWGLLLLCYGQRWHAHRWSCWACCAALALHSHSHQNLSIQGMKKGDGRRGSPKHLWRPPISSHEQALGTNQHSSAYPTGDTLMQLFTGAACREDTHCYIRRRKNGSRYSCELGWISRPFESDHADFRTDQMGRSSPRLGRCWLEGIPGRSAPPAGKRPGRVGCHWAFGALLGSAVSVTARLAPPAPAEDWGPATQQSKRYGYSTKATRRIVLLQRLRDAHARAPVFRSING